VDCRPCLVEGNDEVPKGRGAVFKVGETTKELVADFKGEPVGEGDDELIAIELEAGREEAAADTLNFAQWEVLNVSSLLELKLVPDDPVVTVPILGQCSLDSTENC
jgi:hypothetical protein